MLTNFICKRRDVESIGNFLGISVPDGYFIDDSQKNGHLTYHNTYHMMSVCCYAFSDIFQGPKGYVLTKSEQQILFLSCILHDMHHKQVSGNDFVNIDKAIFYVEQHLHDWFPPEHKRFSDVIKWYVKDTIKCTEFPFKYEPITKVQQIIRDCDLLMATQLDGGLYLRGLCNEMNITNISGEQAVIEHQKFMTSINWYTPMGQDLYNLYYLSTEQHIVDHWLSVSNQFNQVI